ncbi:MAG: archaetidylinositol phosphate synthase [Candidatus Dojkabacteria bacterium]
MISEIRSKFNPFLKAISKPFLKIDPNIISLLGFATSFLFFYGIVSGEYWIALVSFFGNILDALDGTVARTTGKESKFGGFLDSTLDRLSDSVMFLSFGFAGLVNWELLSGVIIVSLMISYVRSRAELAAGDGSKLAIGIIERPERLLFLFISTAIMTFWNFTFTAPLMWVLFALSLFTLVQRIIGAKKLLK